MKKRTNNTAIKIGLLILTSLFALTGFGQDGYEIKESQYDNEGNIFTLSPDDSWANTSDAALPKVLEKVYGVTNVGLRKLYVNRDGKYVFTKFQQTYNGIDVFGGDFIVKRDLNGNILFINGCLRKVSQVMGQRISPNQAIDYAVKALGDEVPNWMIDSSKRGVILDFEKQKFEKPTPSLRYYMKNDQLGGDFVLSYFIEISTNKPAEYQFYVDAFTGAVLGQMNTIHPVVATGNSLYSGRVTFTAENFNDTFIALEDSARKIYTWNRKNKIEKSYYFLDRDTAFNAGWQRPGVDAHWGMSRTYDYFKSDLGRNSFDNKGAVITNNVNFDTNYNNAFWSSGVQAMYYGQGNGVLFSHLVALDVVGHEFTHAVVEHTAGLVYRKESGALNESFADMFGLCIEKKNGGADWKLGEDCYTPGTANDALRDMANPNATRDPDCYEGTHWKAVKGCVPSGGDTGNDWCGVHSNSGVGNFWFYLLTDGGNGRNDKNNNYSVTGLGVTKSAKIAYKALSTYMNSTTDYKGARIATLQAAEDLYGKKSNEYKQVCNAWYAVNVGEKCCPDSMELEFKNTDPLCHDSKDGKIELTIKKAKGPFTFEWYKNDTLGPVVSTAKNLTGVDKGTYWIWVRDTVAKCEKVEKTKLEAPTKVSVSISGGGIHIRACDRKPEIFLQATASGGTSPYTYNWPNGKKVIATSGSVGHSGWYTGTATDKNGCKSSRSTFAFFIPIRCSYDPNDIIGPPAYGDPKWVSINATLPYKIRFENDPKFATAPAQKVTIDHELDSNTNLTSFRLGDFGFASYVFEVPSNSSYYSKRLDLKDSLGIYLDVTAGLDINAKKAFWIFESIDPATGLPPTDANVGFLAVNDTNTHVGEGFVNYTIKSKPTAVTGDSIRAIAEIVFDNNPPLLTPRIHNLIDAVEPTSGIRSLPGLQDSVNIPLTLFGEDDSAASGFGAWDLYVSENGSAFTLHGKGLTDSTLLYRGDYGNEYRFFTRGVDNVNNQEAIKTVADVTVTIAPDVFLRALDSNISLCARDTLEIQWNSLNIPSFDLEYKVDTASTFSSIAKNLNPADSLYSWVVPTSIVGKQHYQVRAIASSSSTPIDTTRSFELKAVPALDLGSDTSFCAGSTINLVLSTAGSFNSYQWSTGDTTSTYTATSTGTYGLTVTNNYSCSSTDSVVVGTYFLPQVTNKTITDVTCFGGSDGSITLAVVSGNPPYTYAWSSGDTTKNITGKPANTYWLTVTDSVMCSNIDTSVIAQPNLLASTPSIANVSCFGGSDGEIDLNISGGTAPFTFVWSNGDTTEKITGLSKGSFSVVTTDANNCVRYDTITITEPNVLTASTSVTNVSCFQGSDGAINLTVAGGTTNYSYAWSNGDTTEDISGLTQATYSVIVTDNNGCLAYDTAVVTQPTELQSSISTTNVSCFGGNNGTIDLTVTGGTPSYSYSWSNSRTTQDIDTLVKGTYTVVISDANGCILRDTATITEPSILEIRHSTSNVSCNGGSDGSINLSVAGGTTTYSFLWSNGDTTEDLSSITAGTYTVLVTDANGCTIRDTATITEPQIITSSGVLTHVTCNGSSNGAVTLTVSGGTTPYSYSWSNGDTTKNITGLAAGSYHVTITDNNNCVHRDTFSITQPNAIQVSKVVKDITCFGNTDGSITLTVTGGVTPYSYVWSNGDTSAKTENLAKGQFTVVVTDSNGCQYFDTTNINEPTLLSVSHAISNVTCNGGSTGSIDLSVSGGTKGYRFVWSNGDTTEDISNVIAGTYSVTVTDTNGCVIRDTATITEPAIITSSGALTMVACNGDSTGAITLTVSGGTTPYNFLWITGDTTQNISSLGAGTYSVQITDSNACIHRDTFVITQPSAIQLSKSVQNISCFGVTDGSITLTMSGGVSPYKYLWSNSDTTSSISGLAKQQYTVIVTDSNGCTFYDSTTITEPSQLVVTSTVRQVSCFGANDGSIDLSTSGGTSPYAWLWSTGDTTEDVSGLSGGQVTVKITDANGCTLNDTTQITEPNQLASSGVVSHVSCFGDASGSIDLTVSGGTNPLSFVWNNGDTVEDITKLVTGTYIVRITDNNNCVHRDTFKVDQPTQLVGVTSTSEVSCFGGSDGSATIVMSGGVLPYTYLWSNAVTTAVNANIAFGTYTVEVKDSNGCIYLDSVSVVQPSQLSVTSNETPVSCFNGSDGSIDLTVTGGTPNYTFVWSNGDTTEDLTGLKQGSFIVTIKDDKGCEFMDTSMITQPSELQLDKVLTHLGCNNDLSGAIDLTISGGTSGYMVVWSNSASTEDLTGLAAGTYSVVVTDANNCKSYDTLEITQPDSLIGSHTHTDVLCFGDADGAIDLTVKGGTMPYSYAWSNSDTTEDINGLSGGNYTVIITDSNNCTWNDTIVISEPPVMVLSLDSVPEIESNANGKAWVTVTGGVGPYTYLWNDNAASTTDTAHNLSRGVYTVVVKDANGCEQTDSINVPSVLSSGNVIHSGAVEVYPNPNYGWVGIYNINDLGSDVQLIMTDVSGRVVLRRQLTNVDDYRLELPQSVIEGTYFLNLHGSTKTAIKQIILIR